LKEAEKFNEIDEEASLEKKLCDHMFDNKDDKHHT
jgi:hypothetical protein